MKIRMEFGKQRTKSYGMYSSPESNNSPNYEGYSTHKTVYTYTYKQVINSLIVDTIKSTRTKVEHLIINTKQVEKIKSEIYKINLTILDLENDEEVQKNYERKLDINEEEIIQSELAKIDYRQNSDLDNLFLQRPLFIKIRPHIGEIFTHQPSKFATEIEEYKEKVEFCRKKVGILEKSIKKDTKKIVTDLIKDCPLRKIEEYCLDCYGGFNIESFHKSVIKMLIIESNTDDIVDIITKRYTPCKDHIENEEQNYL